jgi:glutathione S-transferase
MRRTIRITRSHRACITRISGPRRNGAPLISSLIASKYLGYFERVLEHNPHGDRHLLGPPHQLLRPVAVSARCWLALCFPRAMTRLEPSFARVTALHDRVAARPRIAAYLQSARRIAFNEQGIFRHYPELDDTTSD